MCNASTPHIALPCIHNKGASGRLWSLPIHGDDGSLEMQRELNSDVGTAS